jgi:hypothetical protein
VRTVELVVGVIRACSSTVTSKSYVPSQPCPQSRQANEYARRTWFVGMAASRERSIPCVATTHVDTALALREGLTVLAACSAGGVLVLDLSGLTFCDTRRAIRRTLPLAGIDVMFTGAGAVLRTAADRVGLAGQPAFGDV